MKLQTLYSKNFDIVRKYRYYMRYTHFIRAINLCKNMRIRTFFEMEVLNNLSESYDSI